MRSRQFHVSKLKEELKFVHQMFLTEEMKMEDNHTKDVVKEQSTDEGENLVSPTFTKYLKEKVQVEKIDEALWSLPSGCGMRTGRVGEASKSSTATLDGIMESLTCDDNNTIGLLGPPESDEIADVLDKVSRRAKRDKLFDVIVIATVSHKPNNRKIQYDIAEALGLKFDGENKGVTKRSIGLRFVETLGFKSDDEKDVAERAKRLREKILMEQKILVMLRDICKGIDLDKVGIPSGADHIGYKLLLTSASEEVLSNQMHVQKIFKV